MDMPNSIYNLTQSIHYSLEDSSVVKLDYVKAKLAYKASFLLAVLSTPLFTALRNSA